MNPEPRWIAAAPDHTWHVATHPPATICGRVLAAPLHSRLGPRVPPGWPACGDCLSAADLRTIRRPHLDPIWRDASDPPEHD